MERAGAEKDDTHNLHSEGNRTSVNLNCAIQVNVGRTVNKPRQ